MTASNEVLPKLEDYKIHSFKHKILGYIIQPRFSIVLGGLKPPTLRLLAARSNQLSHKTIKILDAKTDHF